MTSQATIIRPMRMGSYLLAMFPLALFMGLGTLIFNFMPGAALGWAAFLLYRLIFVRRFICADHRRGIVLTRAGQFENAIVAFQRSEVYFNRYSTLDRFRAIILGSATPFSFRILARYNQAYCLSRLKKGSEAYPLLLKILEERPDMLLARELKDVLEAGGNLANINGLRNDTLVTPSKSAKSE